MSKKMTVVLTVALLSGLPLCAQTYRTERIDGKLVRIVSPKYEMKRKAYGPKQIDRNLARIVHNTNPATERVAYENYKNDLAQIKEPTYENLKPAFDKIVSYNTLFANEKYTLEQKMALAGMLNTLIDVGWNTYRKVDMLEIFRFYFPEKNTDKDIIGLEYNVQKYTLPLKIHQNVDSLRNLQDENVIEFNEAYREFLVKMHLVRQNNKAAVSVPFMDLVKAYNRLEEALPGMGSFVKENLFRYPFVAGWGRTTTVQEVQRHIGADVDPAGDGATHYTAEQMAKMYKLSPEDAAVLEQFVRNFYK